MTNLTKWFIAIPFSATLALVVPAAITGDLFWFIRNWADALYVILTAGMWLIATAFVDTSKPRGRPDMANILISLGLILSVPVSVYDRKFLMGSVLPGWISFMGLAICLAAVVLGLWARIALGESYSPRGQSSVGHELVRSGPFHWIRHPLYASALLWSLGWPLIITSILGALLTLGLVVPAVLKRIDYEEKLLLGAYGESYVDYQKATWRLLPHVY